jgi:hypothetical protein
VVIWKLKTGFRYHYSPAPSKLVSLCGSHQLLPWYVNINPGYKPYKMVAKGDASGRPHILTTARIIIKITVAEEFL